MARNGVRKQCPHCKREFTAKRSNKVFCSDKCRWGAANRERLEALRRVRGNEID